MNSEEKVQFAGYWIRRFLSEYLVTVKNMSQNTRKSYRDTFRLLLPYIASHCRKAVDQLKLVDITATLLKDFLNSLETERGCSIRTRNQRLTAVISLSRYVSMNSPEHIEWCREIRSIPVKKAAKKQITYLEKAEMQKLLDAPDIKTEQGWRDHVLLLYLYNTGARAEEAASLKVRDIISPRGPGGLAVVTITGKGNKTRRCPLWKTTKDALISLTKGRDPDENVFLNRLGNAITRFGVYEMVRRYAEQLERTDKTLKAKRISPHTIRHTTATHLLQSGVDINTIRAWLGHVSINTTNIYAEIDMNMKVKALLTCEEPNQSTAKKHWRDDTSLMSFLDNL